LGTTARKANTSQQIFLLFKGKQTNALVSTVYVKFFLAKVIKILLSSQLREMGGGKECILQKHRGKKDELFFPKEHRFEFLVIFLL
jgi:hypothetical protein